MIRTTATEEMVAPLIASTSLSRLRPLFTATTGGETARSRKSARKLSSLTILSPSPGVSRLSST